MTQETLEEAAERVYRFEADPAFPDEIEHEEFLRIFKKGAKWQAEKMYSEEEVKQMLIDCCGEVSCKDGVLVGKTPVELYKWIDEQFKNKQDD